MKRSRDRPATVADEIHPRGGAAQQAVTSASLPDHARPPRRSLQKRPAARTVGSAAAPRSAADPAPVARSLASGRRRRAWRRAWAPSPRYGSPVYSSDQVSPPSVLVTLSDVGLPQPGPCTSTRECASRYYRSDVLQICSSAYASPLWDSCLGRSVQLCLPNRNWGGQNDEA